ncbi:MAG: hypothetical protein ACRDZX_06750 [Acidimicrobiales bacterium]
MPTEVEMTKVVDAPFLEDATGRRRQSSRATRHAVRSHLHVASLDGDALDGAVLPVVPHDVGRKASPRPLRAPAPGRRGGFKVWKTAFWKRRRRLWAERNAAARAIARLE